LIGEQKTETLLKMIEKHAWMEVQYEIFKENIIVNYNPYFIYSN
jgi:hypothetical protein